MAAPGAQPTAENSPVSYKLRQEIRRQREEVGRAERRLRELEVEASLAGVPAEWRGPVQRADAAPATSANSARLAACDGRSSAPRARGSERGQREGGGEREVAGVADRLGDPPRRARQQRAH